MADLCFRHALLRVTRDGVPGSGDDLLGMQIDFDALLSKLLELDAASVTVASTCDSEQLLRAAVRTAKDVRLETGARAVEDLWGRHLRYPYFEAHEVLSESGAADLNFVTQIGPSQLYVTGQIHVAVGSLPVVAVPTT